MSWLEDVASAANSQPLETEAGIAVAAYAVEEHSAAVGMEAATCTAVVVDSMDGSQDRSSAALATEGGGDNGTDRADAGAWGEQEAYAPALPSAVAPCPCLR